jgi:hypothetical protein
MNFYFIIGLLLYLKGLTRSPPLNRLNKRHEEGNHQSRKRESLNPTTARYLYLYFALSLLNDWVKQLIISYRIFTVNQVGVSTMVQETTFLLSVSQSPIY